MTAVLEPSVTFTILPASQLAGVQDQKVLIVGQMLSGGTATGGQLYTDLSDNTAANNALFGRAGHLAGMIRAFKRENEISRLDVIPLTDGVGVVGTCVVTISGTATEAGSITVSIGSAKDHSYTLSIASGDSASDVGDLLDAATDADLDAPFTGVNAAGTVTVSCDQHGTFSNAWDVRVSGEVAGIVIALTGWTGGTTPPTLTSILDVIGEIRYQTIVWPNDYDTLVLETLLNARFNSVNQILDGVGIQVKVDTLASLKSYVDQNSQSLVIIGNGNVSETDRIGSVTPEMPDIVAAETAAVRALRFTEDALLTSYLTTVAPLDQYGGIALASLPYFNTLYPNIEVGEEQDMWTGVEQNELRDNGISNFGANRSFNGVIMGEFVTTYLTNSAGNSDASYKFLNTVDTASVIREYFYENSRSRYAQTRLTDGDLIAGRDMANEASIRAFFGQLYDALADETLVRKGSVAKKDFNDNLSIALTISTGTATVSMSPLLVTQLRVILGTIQINFGG